MIFLTKYGIEFQTYNAKSFRYKQSEQYILLPLLLIKRPFRAAPPSNCLGVISVQFAFGMAGHFLILCKDN